MLVMRTAGVLARSGLATATNADEGVRAPTHQTSRSLSEFYSRKYNCRHSGRPACIAARYWRGDPESRSKRTDACTSSVLYGLPGFRVLASRARNEVSG